eukprot:6193767-Pleurochrysis_carterae.AAC.2
MFTRRARGARPPAAAFGSGRSRASRAARARLCRSRRPSPRMWSLRALALTHAHPSSVLPTLSFSLTHRPCDAHPYPTHSAPLCAPNAPHGKCSLSERARIAREGRPLCVCSALFCDRADHAHA